MSRNYGKIIVGEAIDEQSSPFLAIATHNGNANTDIESASAVPIYTEESYIRRPSPPHPPHHRPPPGMYGTYQHGPGPQIEHFAEPGEDCAQIGCFFSWIPPIGFLTCIIHADAPPLSRREFWAGRACIIATLVTIGIIIYFSMWYQRNKPTDISFH